MILFCIDVVLTFSISHRIMIFPWWRHQMETFSALLAICAGNSPVPGELPAQRPVTRSFDIFFDLRPNKQLSKQRWGWWFETLSCPLWRHRNIMMITMLMMAQMVGWRWYIYTHNTIWDDGISNVIMISYIGLTTAKHLIQSDPNSKTTMFLVLSCSCLCLTHWSQVLSREWRFR